MGVFGQKHVQCVTMVMPNGGGAGLSDPPSTAPSTLVELLDQVDRALDATMEPATSAEGISREGWRVLLLLAKAECGLSMGEIAEQAELAAPTATRVVDRLVADKLADRRGDPEDRRRVLVHLAPRGREVLRRVSGRLETSSRAELADLLEALVVAVPRDKHGLTA
jgi:DNA-binding MarR family transcriptional regulator